MQSINLYQVEFQPNRSPLQLTQMLLLAGLLVLVLIAVSGWWLWGNHQLREQLHLVQDREAQLIAERDAMAAASRGVENKDLDAQLAELRRDIATRKSLSELLGDQSLGNSDGFSAQLQALAQVSDNSFALQAFQLTQEGRYLTMAGITKSPAAIPGYLQKLERTQAFSVTRFGVLNLAPREDGFFNFSVTSPDQSPDQRQESP